MASADYWRFIAEARDVFGLTLGEAREFWRDLRDELDERPTVDDLGSDEALSLFEDYIYPRDERYELEYGDDDIIYEGEEVEVTAELEYTPGGKH